MPTDSTNAAVLTSIPPVNDAPPSLEAAPLRAELTRQLGPLRGRALHLCRNSAGADDLVQDTVKRALEFEHTYIPGTNARAWLSRIMLSVFVSGKRRQTREGRALARFVRDPNVCATTSPAPQLRRLTPSLQRAVNTLPAEFARVLWLVDVEGLSYREAAESLKVPVGTVMSRLWRGRQRLGQALEAGAAKPAEGLDQEQTIRAA